MKTFQYPAETPINEEWIWLTDVQTNDNGSEVRVCLRDEPKRVVNVKYVFTDEDELRRARNIVFTGFDAAFGLPWWQSAGRLTNTAPAGSGLIPIAPGRTDLRDGCEAILTDRTGAVEAVTIGVVQGASATVIKPLARRWPRGASIVPVWPVYSGANVSLTRFPIAGASFGFNASDVAFMVPFLNPANVSQFASFKGLPLFLFSATGSTFDETFSNGTTVTDFGGVVRVRTPWAHQAMQYARTFIINRTFDPDAWQRFLKLADYMKGSQNPIYMPTYREDFKVLLRPFQGSNTVTFEGTDYADDFYPFDAFKQLAIFAREGVHYASVTACAKVGSNSVVTFDPPLPAGAGWTIEQEVSLLLKLRISDDKIALEHTALQTKVGINFRTVDA